MRGRLLSRFAPVVPDPGSVVDASVASSSQLARAAALSAPDVLRCGIYGDSRAVGSLNAGLRRLLSRALSWLGVACEFVGPVLGGDFYRFELHDWRHGGYSGEKWADFTANIAARAAVAGPADVHILELSTNDLLSHNAIATIKADAIAGVAALRAIYPTSIILVNTPSVLPSDATAEALRAQYNAWLLASPSSLPGLYAFPSGDPLTYVVDTGSSLTKGDLVDDRHPDESGNAIIAEKLAQAIVTLFPLRRGRPWPRALTTRKAVAKALAIGDNTSDFFGVVNRPAAMLHAGYSYAIDGWHAPTLVDTTARSICSYASYGAGGYQLAHGLGSTAKNFGVHLAGQGQVLTSGVVSHFTAAAWHHWLLAFLTRISATDTRPCAALWIDGRLVGVATVTAWADSNSDSLLIGANATNGTRASQGQTSTVRIGQWQGVPYLSSMDAIAKAAYAEGAPVPGGTARFSLDNVLTDAFGGASGALSGGAAFATTSPARPTDP